MGRPTGPAPKLAEQRVLEGGSPRAGTISHHAKPDVVALAPRVEKFDIPEPPDDLDDDGKDLWRTVVPWLVEMNAVQLIDLPAIKAMCIAWEQAEKSRRVIDTQGYFTLGSMGQMIEHPALKAYNSASTLFLRYAQEFGLTTVARTRLGLLDVQRKSIQAEMDWTLGPSTRRTDG